MQPLHHQTRYSDVELGAPEQTEILRNQSLAHFAIDPKTLDCILDANNIDFLGQYGGVEGIGSALESHLEMGIKGDDQDLRLRHEVFGSNLFDEDGDHQLELSEAKSYFKLAFKSFKEPTTILLLCCATLSVVFGVLKDGTQSGLFDGTMMFILVLVSFIVRLFKERAHRRMLTIAKNNSKVVDVIRDGNPQKIPASQVTVGEIVILKTGDRVPADGLFIKGSSSFKLDDVENEDPIGMDYNRFPAIHGGTEVAVGDCQMIVISVGKNPRWSKMMNHFKSRWLFNVDKLSANMEKIMLGLSLVLLVVQLLCYFLKKTNNNGISIKRNLEETKSIMNTSVEELINDVTIVFKKNTGIFSRLIAILGVVLMGVREGLNLGIFTNFRCSKRKLKIDHQAIVTNLPAFAGLGLVTTIYTCETVDLALNKTSKADLWIGGKIVKEATTELTQELLDTLREGVGHLTTSGHFKDPLLCWAKLFLGVKMEELVQSFTILHTEEEASIDGNCHGLSLRRNGDNQKNIIHMHWRGDIKIVLPMCSHFYSVDGQQNYIDENQRMNLEKISEQIASDCVHCIALAYTQVLMENGGGKRVDGDDDDDDDDDDDEPPKLIKQEEEDLLVDNGEEESPKLKKQEEIDLVDEEEKQKEQEPPKLMRQKMTFLGFVGLKNPYEEDLKPAVKTCREAGVNITLILNQDTNTATFMGVNSGVVNPTDDDISKAIVEAFEIRNILENDESHRRSVSDIRVLTNSSPSDKLRLIQYQRQQQTTGEVIAVTGRSTRDSQAFNEADIGFWIGDSDSKVAAKESSSDIIMLNRSLESIVAVIKRGRFVYQNMEKFIQLHLTVNIVGVAVNFIAAIPSGNTPLSAVQLLWVGLVTDTLGAFALAASDPPPGKTIPLASALLPSKAVWRNVLIQVVYQTGILLMLHFKGRTILHVDDDGQATIDVIVFNTYIMFQVFGLLNASQIERRRGRWGEIFSWKNFSEKIYRNRWFVGAAGATVVLHSAAVEIAMAQLCDNNDKMRLLDYRKWLFCTGLAALSWPIGCVAKSIPVSPWSLRHLWALVRTHVGNLNRLMCKIC